LSRLSVRGLGAYAAACMSVSPACAGDIELPGEINLHCSAPRLGISNQVTSVRALSDAFAPPPWISRIAGDYRINLGNSTVNGEILRIDQIDNQITAKLVKLAWHRAADAAVPAAHYMLNLRTNEIVVFFDDGEYNGRKSSTALQLRCERY
jgi:hypothetical protein